MIDSVSFTAVIENKSNKGTKTDSGRLITTCLHPNYKKIRAQFNKQTQWHSGKIADLSAGRHGVQSSIPGRGEWGSIPLILYKLGQPLKTFISHSLLSVPNYRERLFRRVLYSYFISAFMLSVLSAYTKKLSFLHV